MSTPLLTPVGRLVQGDCFEGQTKDAEGNPLVVKTGPNAGQPRVDYFMGIAIPKNAPEWPALWEAIKAEAIAGFAHLAPHIQAIATPADIGQLQFAFKVTDGDSNLPNKRGTIPNSREGFPGHWILSFSGGFAPKCYTRNGDALIVDPNAIKRGYYIRISGSVAGNNSQQQPGIYLNHSMVELIGYGEEIISGPDGAAVFGGAPAAALPAGVSATPLAPATPLATVPATTAPAATVPATTAPAATVPATTAPAATVPATTAPVAAAADFLSAPAAAAAPAAPEPLYKDANGNGAFTNAQLVAAGFTPEAIAALQRAN